MAEFFQVHPETPQTRLVTKIVDVVERGGVIVYPTDSGYALGCHLGDKQAIDRVRRIRQLDDKHNFTIVCRDLSALAQYARVDNVAYRILRSHTPGTYTFILLATGEVPRALKHKKRKTIGLRVPDNRIAMALLETLHEPMMTTSLILPGDDTPLLDPYEIRDVLGAQVDVIVDGGYCGMTPTSVLDLTDETPVVVRQGQGDVSEFLP